MRSNSWRAKRWFCPFLLDVMKKLEIQLDEEVFYRELQRIYDERVSRDTDKEKMEDRMRNRGRGR